MKLLTRGRLIAAVGIVALGVVVIPRGTSKTSDTRPKRVSVPYDWSHRHVVFSKPATLQQAAQLQQDPRYWHQLLRRNSVGRVAAVGASARLDLRNAARLARRHGGAAPPIDRDWAEPLGSGASTGNATFPQFPAKFTSSIDPNDESCSDFVVFPTSVAGATGTSDAVPGQPSIIAFNNLYSAADGSGACGLAPAIAFAYNTNASGDTTGVVSGSPVVSGDGTKVAFVETTPSGSILHLVQYTIGDGTDINNNGVLLTAPPTNLLTAGSGWNACPTDGSSCMISLMFSNGTAGNSSPFYNFAFDTLYLGDDSGVLHKFTGVFNGTPAEVTSGGWPITVHAGVALTPPVQDSAANTLFVGDSTGVLSFVMDAGSTTGSCLGGGAPPCLGSTTVLATDGSRPIIDPPVLDPTTGKVFVFVGDSGPASLTVLGVARRSYVVQASENLTGVVRLVAGGSGAALHTGAFDNTYLNSSPGAIAGFMYVCGKAGLTDHPALRRVRFLADGTAQRVDLNTLQVGNNAGSAGQCSPVTEIFNPNIGVGTDLIFFSVQSGGRPAACALGGCVVSADVTTIFPGAVAAAAPETGGASGIVIDNIGTFGQDSSIYFTRLGQSTLTNCGGSGATLVGCAVKLTQAGLN
jgi:hypothetical protein